jgi:dTDP-4-dehydrorhamnose reductase
LAIAAHAATIIIRTSWVYSSYGNNFVKTMMRLMAQRESLNVVADQFGSPTYAEDLAKLIMQIINKTVATETAWVPGIYHYSNEGVISWYDFAVAIAAISKSACTVHPIPTSGYPTPAKRPAYSVFNKEKVVNTFHMAIPNWKDSLEACILKLQGDIA